MPARPKLVLALAALALWGVSAGLALAAPGELDTSFGVGGRSVVDLGADDSGNAAALQPDGRIVVAGRTTGAGGFDMAVARLLVPQGTLDTSYGPGTGWSRVDLGGNDSAAASRFNPTAGSSSPARRPPPPPPMRRWRGCSRRQAPSTRPTAAAPGGRA